MAKRPLHCITMGYRVGITILMLFVLLTASRIQGLRLPASRHLTVPHVSPCHGLQSFSESFTASFWARFCPGWLRHRVVQLVESPKTAIGGVEVAQSQATGTASSAELPPLAEAKAAFLAEHGSDYGYNGWIDAHWQQEVGVRLPGDQHYLDYTGSGQYATSQISAAARMLTTQAFGNPHSRNPSSYRSAQMEAAARARVLQWLGADPEEYVLVWTRSATEALKMVGEWFPWTPAADFHPPAGTPPGGVSDHTVGHVSRCGGPLHFMRDKSDDHGMTGEASSPASSDYFSHFVYTRANHKSVLGIGAYAQDKGALISCADEADIDKWLSSREPDMQRLGQKPAKQPYARGFDDDDDMGASRQGRLDGNSTDDVPTYSLLAFPAKDNYEGVLYPLKWVKQAHAKSTRHHKWLVMLDAAAYLPVHALNLTTTPADFVSMSFYKIFGYPTGLGALVMRKEAANILHKVYFGGGAVDDATAQDLWRLLSPAPARFQDGTIDFQGVAQLQFGFDLLDQLGGLEAVHRHVSALQSWTYKHLSSLLHSNKQPLLKIFGKHDAPQQQSCLFQFLVYRSNGSVVAAQDVEITAAAAGLHLRTGCHCNPGQCIKDLGIHPAEERAAALAHNTTHGFITVQRQVEEGGKTHVKTVKLPIGSVRASLGSLSTFEDVYALVKFLKETYVDQHGVAGDREGQVRIHGAPGMVNGVDTVPDFLLHNISVQDYWNAQCGA